MFKFTLEKEDSRARAWTFETPHWKIQTPVFMPVWTKATVKWIHKEELDEMWAQIILNNTYHLYLKPGADIVKQFWGTHKFMNYNKPILTDSWGFQVFSLWQVWEWTGGFKNKESLVKITEEWVHFRSFIDGSKHYFSAENVMDIQSDIWADIIMAFDECAPWKSDWSYAKKAMERTHRWAVRSYNQVEKNNEIRKNDGRHEQALFPIVQWVTYDDLRIESVNFMNNNIPSHGIAIWWLSVWEAKPEMYRILDLLEKYLPKNKPRYLMWIWTPEDLVECIYRWIDMFDCVLPTRIWRHGSVFSHNWYIRVKNEKYKLSDEKLDNLCDCKVCKNYSKWYLRHLIQEDEMLWLQLLSYHNLYFLVNLAKKARNAVIEWKYDEFRNEFWSRYDLSLKK